jgi:hypothetical protein
MTQKKLLKAVKKGATHTYKKMSSNDGSKATVGPTLKAMGAIGTEWFERLSPEMKRTQPRLFKKTEDAVADALTKDELRRHYRKIPDVGPTEMVSYVKGLRDTARHHIDNVAATSLLQQLMMVQKINGTMTDDELEEISLLNNPSESEIRTMSDAEFEKLMDHQRNVGAEREVIGAYKYTRKHRNSRRMVTQEECVLC